MTRAHFNDGLHDSAALARGGYYFAPGTVEEYSPRTSVALYALAVVLALCLVAAIAVAAGYLTGGPL
ncbi:hypothetical protein [Paracidovorax wautersii]|uniref:hypothetical protein n=1 Tax=Paracidovorax wautersii TaxID=1177982 RepID=UPI0031DF35A2